MQRKLTTLAIAAMLMAGPLAAGAAVCHVVQGASGSGASWSDATGDLQAAIDAANSGDQIWIASGTYHPTSLIKSTKKTSKAFILKDGVSLYGGFAGTETSLDERATGSLPYEMTNETILSADDDVPDIWTRVIDPATTYRWTWETESNVVPGTKNNSSHVLYCASAFSQPTVIDGLTLTGANANVYQAKAAGGAVYALGNVALSRCRIVENSAYFTPEANDCDTYGGAVYLDGGSMTDCLVSRAFSHSSFGNGLGGAVYAQNANISNCIFEDCVGLDQGGAVYLKGGTLSDCSFIRCYSSAGGAILNNGGTVDRITVNDCRALQGGAVYNAGKLSHALISGCYADATEYSDNGGKGGGILNISGDVSDVAVTNCSSWLGGGVYLTGGRLINSTVLNNSIRSLDGAANVYVQTPAEVLNTISDPATALSNFISPTSFSGFPKNEGQSAALEAADWSLTPGSTFIDAGEPVEGFTSGLDLAGNPRVAGASIDRGAYESQGDAKLPVITLTFDPSTTSARLALGGAGDYEFSVDWGDGNEVTYSGQAYYSHELLGSTVKVYGDDIILFRGASQGIVTADMSRAHALQQIMIGSNPLVSLNLGEHPSMTGLYAENGLLRSINVSGCPSLRVLDIHENAIEGEIDCSAMASLSKVDIADNHFTSLTLPKHSVVYEVDCSRNALTELDVTGLSGLSSLSCSENALTSLDLTGLDSVEEIYADGNQLSSLDIAPCGSLNKIMAAENKIESIDLSQNASLSGVYLQDNLLTSIDVSANPNVRWLNIGNNNVEVLDVRAQRYLSILIANNNAISAIDLSSNTSLSSLDLSGNALNEIDLTACGYLSQCHLENNTLTSLDLSNNPYLYGLFCGNNALTSLNLSANTYLQRLEAQGNALTSLDIAANAGLQSIFLQSNKFDTASLDALIAQLPDVTGVNVTDETASFLRQLNISFMPGTADADIAPAETKGWTVTAEYESEEPVTLTSLDLQLNYSGDNFLGTYPATIEYGNDEKTTIRIISFMESGSNVVANVDSEGNVKIAPQVCGGDINGNFYMIVNAESTDGNPMDIYNTYVSGHFDGTTLTLEPWNLIIVPYTFSENLGTVYPENLTSKFVRSNGTLETTLESGATMTNKVYGEIIDETVAVYGWGGYARTVLSKENGMWSIDASATACTLDGKDYMVATADGADVKTTDVVDARTLVFGSWQLRPAAGNALVSATSSVLHLGFDLPVSVGIDEVGANDVVETIYINAAGVSSPDPFDGFNVKVETMSDGSRRTLRVIIRK